MTTLLNEIVYLDTLRTIKHLGTSVQDRTGTGTLRMLGLSMNFDLRRGFPLLTTKKVYIKGIIAELIMFLKGETNISFLHKYDTHIWDEWADKNGNLGPIYGSQWVNWGGESINQLQTAIDTLNNNPYSRRNIVTAWNVSDLDKMALPPCHMQFQLFVEKDRLDLLLYQRSADFFLGVPFNIASYAILMYMLAQQTGLTPGILMWRGGDCHIYQDHLEQVELQLSRQPMHPPTLNLKSAPSLFDYGVESVQIVNYKSHPAIKAKVSV